MANIFTILKIGYALMVISLLLMMWISWIGAIELENPRDYPPCYFNPLCTCSKAVPDLGIVQCANVPLSKIPQSLNSSKVYMLKLENNGLKWFEPYFLQGTGLYRLEINHNPLGEIPDGAFSGLERFLWELRLKHNNLIDIPTRSLRFLQKLRLLDLTGNDISDLEPDDWRGLESSLNVLILADNSISKLSADTFSGLPLLETIDLRGNNLKFIDPNVFRDGLGQLSKVLLGDNQLTEIPYLALSPLKMLQYLDLSKNYISVIYPEQIDSIQPLALDTLRLDYNLIPVIHAGSFQLFSVVNNTYLDGNPINFLEDNAFLNAKIRYLSLRNCKLTTVSPAAFNGLEASLQVLDLSGNNITGVEHDMFVRFQDMHSLSLRENLIANISPFEVFNGFQYSLIHLDLSGENNAAISLQDLRRLRNLRSLIISNLAQTQIGPDDFTEFGVNLEKLSIISSNLKTIKSHTFTYVRGLKELDLSENHIQNLENDCFSDVSRSLISLNLAHSLDKSIKNLPIDALKLLSNLQYLNLANNYLKSMPDTSFHFLQNLKRVELQDNKIEQIHKGTFQGDIHSSLQEVFLSFNFIKEIQQHTFVDLIYLHHLYLDDNRIETINRRSFMNLDRLKYLTLRGNKITTIAEEAFQNLPELIYLDLAYNHMSKFDFGIFDQVGTLSAFKVNISHNKIEELRTNYSNFINGRDDLLDPYYDRYLQQLILFTTQMQLCVCTCDDPEVNAYFLAPVTHSNIKILDLSFNNISFISRAFFRPAEISMTHLHLSHNKLTNITRDVFGSIPHLQWLDLSVNEIDDVELDSFRNTRKLQVLRMSHNKLETLPAEVFQGLSELRILDLSNNFIRSLPDYILSDDSLEKLDLSNNEFNKMPLSILSAAAASNLCELDLSGNNIVSVAYPDMLSRFKSLLSLDLSNNMLLRIDESAFAHLPKLMHLDLSNNKNLDLAEEGLSFRGLEHSLLELKINNISLLSVPELPFLHLRLLSIAGNELPTVPPEMASNMTNLRHLDLSFNDLTAIPLVTHSLSQLRTLSLTGNPITTISNTSLLGVAEHLKELDIRQLDLSTFETGSLDKMDSLRVLHVGVQKKIKNFNLPKILKDTHALRHLHIEVEEETDLVDEMAGIFPIKLRNITFSGMELHDLGNSVLDGVQSPVLNVAIRDSSITNLKSNLFDHMKFVRNITLDIKNTGSLTQFDNPSTGERPNLPRDTFLTSLQISGSGFKCDCQIGWIEVWERKKRQYLCNDGLPAEKNQCRLASDELRSIICANKGNASLIEVLKTDIECGWGSDGAYHRITAPVLVALAILLRII